MKKAEVSTSLYTKTKHRVSSSKVAKKNVYISVQLNSLLPDRYTAYERNQLKEFEKKVMQNYCFVENAV